MTFQIWTRPRPTMIEVEEVVAVEAMEAVLADTEAVTLEDTVVEEAEAVDTEAAVAVEEEVVVVDMEAAVVDTEAAVVAVEATQPQEAEVAEGDLEATANSSCS